VNLTAGQDEINCTYCGTLVKRPEAEAQFAEIKNSKFGGTLLIAETAQEGGSYTEALNYYNKVIEQQPDFADAWLNKGICMVRTSKIGDLKIPEAISSWKAAIKFAKHPDAMKKRVALEINNVVSDFYPILEEHYRKFSEVDDSYEEHVRRFNLLDSALALALEFNPESKAVANSGIALCDRFLESVKRAPRYGQAVAYKIATPVKRTRSKYEQALVKIDPIGVEVEARQKRKDDEQAMGVGYGVLASLVLLIIGGVAICYGVLAESSGTRVISVTVGVFFLFAGIRKIAKATS
jgi:tetratricopeptide (TPR) repeat protein